jgi:hypothetical protein
VVVGVGVGMGVGVRECPPPPRLKCGVVCEVHTRMRVDGW